MRAVSRSPPNDAVSAGATTRSGPRWPSVGISRSLMTIATISRTGTAIRAGFRSADQ